MKSLLHVGKALQRRRKEAGLSLRALASKTGFTASFLSQVERGLASPSIASLARIGLGLGLTIGQFFREAAPDSPTVIKGTHRAALQSRWSRAKLEAISPTGNNSTLEAIMVTMNPGGSSGSRAHAHPAEQLGFIFSGHVQLLLDGAEHRLRPGDSVCIPPGTRHLWQNHHQKPTQILLITARSRL